MKLSREDLDVLLSWFRAQNIFLLDKENSTLFNIEEISEIFLYENLVEEGI